MMKNVFLARFKNWGQWPCKGKMVNSHCTYGVGDLPLLFNRSELFANRFQIDFEPATLDCMEELLYNRTRDEKDGRARALNISYYAGMDYVKNHVEVKHTL